MAQIHELRRRIRSVSNTRQTTRAMQMVSASKLRRAQASADRSRDYIVATTGILRRLLASGLNPRELGLWERPEIKTAVIIAVASDSGLAGAYNLNIAARLRARVAHYQQQGTQVEMIAIGGRIAKTAARLKDVTVREQYTGWPVDPSAQDVQPIAARLRQAYLAGEIDAVECVFTRSLSALTQQVETEAIWPLSEVAELADVKATATMQLEPSPEEVAEAALARLFDAHLLHATQEAAVSEHAMRMLAMRNATDNASDLIEQYTLEVNTIRQAGITQELAEITGAAAAIEEQ
jgi:F-type H+-transporting ATPase subunit gamma